MNTPEFQLHIQGAKVDPQSIDVDDLLEVLKNLRKAIVLAAAASDDVDLEQMPALSLVGVESGSTLLKLVINRAVVPGLIAIGEAIGSANFTALPTGAHQLLATISKQAVAHGWELEFSPGQGAPVRRVRIGDGHEVPLPGTGQTKGTTTIYGRLMKVGGKEPKVALKLSDTERQIIISVDEALACELGSRLYKVIGIECEAVWNIADWSMSPTRVLRVLPYQPGGLVDAFRELATASPEQWKNVDASEYVRSLRGEDDEE